MERNQDWVCESLGMGGAECGVGYSCVLPLTEASVFQAERLGKPQRLKYKPRLRPWGPSPQSCWPGGWGSTQPKQIIKRIKEVVQGVEFKKALNPLG